MQGRKKKKKQKEPPRCQEATETLRQGRQRRATRTSDAAPVSNGGDSRNVQEKSLSWFFGPREAMSLFQVKTLLHMLQKDIVRMREKIRALSGTHWVERR